MTVSSESGRPYRGSNSLVYLLKDGGRGLDQGKDPKDMFLTKEEITALELRRNWYLGSGNEMTRSEASKGERERMFGLSTCGWTAQVKWCFGFMHCRSRAWVWRDVEYNFVLRYTETTILHRL